MKTLAEHKPIRTAAFDSDIRAAVQRVRRALAESIGAAGGDAAKPQALARHLGLDKSLAWKVARVVTDDDPLAAIPRMPGRSGFRILCEALAKAGAGAESMGALATALAEFDNAVARHAGSRGTLDMMVASGSVEKQRERDEAHRKLAFQGNSATWGVQARVQVTVHMLAPSARAGHLDTAVITGFVDLRRLRNDVAWAVGAARLMRDDGGALIDTPLLPLDSTIGPEDPAPLLRDFSTPGLPGLRRAPGVHGSTRFELAEGAVGNTGAATCMLGWINRPGASFHRGEGSVVGEHAVLLVTPAESMIFDFFIHRSLGFAMKPRPSIYNQLPGGPMYPMDGRERTRLPILDAPIDLGGGPPDLTTLDVPKYPAMLDLAAARLGHDIADFHGFRFKLKYPPIPTFAAWTYDLPE